MKNSKKNNKKANKKISRQEHKLDATGVSLGRLASQIAVLLIGKHKVSYLTQADLGDKVVVENVSQIKLTGAKLDDKKYYRHTGYPGHIKVTQAGDLLKKNPAKLLRDCVWNMLPKNRQRNQRIKRLTIK